VAVGKVCQLCHDEKKEQAGKKGTSLEVKGVKGNKPGGKERVKRVKRVTQKNTTNSDKSDNGHFGQQQSTTNNNCKGLDGSTIKNYKKLLQRTRVVNNNQQHPSTTMD